MRKILCIALLLSAYATSALAEVKIAYVDMQRALLEVDEGKTAKAALEKMKAERQGKLDERQAELRELQKNLENQKAFMKPDVLQQKEGEFREKLGELQKTYVDLQKELAQEEAKLTKAIFGRMGQILTSMGEEGKYTMIFEKTESSLLWAERHLDLTNDLIRRFNEGEGKKGKSKPKSPKK